MIYEWRAYYSPHDVKGTKVQHQNRWQVQVNTRQVFPSSMCLFLERASGKEAIEEWRRVGKFISFPPDILVTYGKSIVSANKSQRTQLSRRTKNSYDYDWIERDCLICWFNLLKWIKFDYVKFAKQMTLHVPNNVILKTRCHEQWIISPPVSTSSIVFSFNTLAVLWFLAISLLQGKNGKATNLFMFSHNLFFSRTGLRLCYPNKPHNLHSSIHSDEGLKLESSALQYFVRW